jgi:HEAT repeat protein/WD40 repeat protein/predicted RNA-binding Zn-ribbon protein involved in translation (DUF1610 family)
MTVQINSMLETVRQLRRRAVELAALVEKDLTRLEQTGIAPGTKTMSALKEYRYAVRDLIGAAAPNAPTTSLAELEEMLTRQISTAATERIVRQVVDPLLAIEHTEDRAFAPLSELQKTAARLELAISRGTADGALLLELQSGSHVWCKLLGLIVQGSDLGDAVWEEYYDAVEKGLGRSMAIASSRGKLVLPAKVLSALKAEDADSMPPRDTVTVPRPEDVDLLSEDRINRRFRRDDTAAPDPVFNGSPASGTFAGPGADDLAELDALEDPDGADSDVWATAASGDGEEARSQDSDSRIVGDLPPAASDASSGKDAQPRRFAGLSSSSADPIRDQNSVSMPAFPTSGVRIPALNGSSLSAIGLSNSSGVQLAHQHSGDATPCPSCGSDIFPAMARCRSCGLVHDKSEPHAAHSTISGLFQTAPDVLEEDLSPSQASSSSESGTGFELQKFTRSSSEIRIVDHSTPRPAPKSLPNSSAEIAIFANNEPPTPRGDQTAGGSAPLPTPMESPNVAAAAARSAAANPDSPAQASSASVSGAYFVEGQEIPRNKLRTICEHCTNQFLVPKSLASQPVSCPSCGQSTVAPSASPSNAEVRTIDVDLDITLFTVRESVEAALLQPAAVSERVWLRPLNRTQWKNLSSVVVAISPTSPPHECDRVRLMVEALGQSGDERAAELLRTIFHQLPPSLQTDAIKALASLDDRAAVPVVMRVLYEEKSPAVPAAIQAMGSYRELRAIEPLMLLAVACPDHRTRVVHGLTNYGEAAIPALTRMAAAAQPDALRFLAAEVLGRLQSPKSVAPLADLLKGPNLSLQRLAAEGLSAIKSKKVIRPLIEALQNPDEAIRIHASQGLIENPDPKSTKFLLRSLKDRSLDVRKNIVAAIGLSGDENVVNTIKQFLHDPSREMVAIAAEAVGRLGQNTGIPILVRLLEEEALTNENRPLIQRIFKALRTLKDRRSIVPLIGYLESTDTVIRRRAIEALGPISDPAVRRALENVLRTDRSDEIRAAAAIALGEQGQKHAIPALEAALTGLDRVRIGALQAIGMLKEKTSRPKVLPLLEHENARIRNEAVRCLGQIGASEDIPSIAAHLGDADPDVRAAVADALKALGDTRSVNELATIASTLTAAAPPPASRQAPASNHSVSVARGRSRVAAMTDFVGGLVGNPILAIREASPRKMLTLGGSTAALALIVAMGFFTVQGSGSAAYRRAWVQSASVSPSGKWAVTGRTSGALEIWNIADQRRVDYSLKFPSRFITFGAVDGVIAGVGSKEVVLASVSPSGGLGPIEELGTHPSNVVLACSTLDGRMLATADLAQIKVWNLVDKKLVREISIVAAFEDKQAVRAQKPPSIASIAISESGKVVALVTRNRGTRVWRDGELVPQTYVSKSGTGGVLVAASPTDQEIAILEPKGNLVTWSIDDGKPLKTLAGSSGISSLVYLDSNRLLEAQGGKTTIWDIASENLKVADIPLPGLEGFDVAPDGKLIVAGHIEESELLAFDLEEGKVLQVLDIQ